MISEEHETCELKNNNKLNLNSIKPFPNSNNNGISINAGNKEKS